MVITVMSEYIVLFTELINGVGFQIRGKTCKQ
jgi:hypothetical protein